MNQEIINSIFKYIEVLYKNNQKLIKIFGIDAIDATLDGSKDLLDIIQDIPRLIPYGYSKKNKKLLLFDSDGLLEYKLEIPNLRDDYELILEKHYPSLEKIRIIRNKYEHILHNIELCSCYTGNDDWFRYGFKINKEKIIIDSKELVNIFKDLNKLYDELRLLIMKFAYVNGLDHPFFKKIEKISFLKINNLYDSKNLYTIGKIIVENF